MELRMLKAWWWSWPMYRMRLRISEPFTRLRRAWAKRALHEIARRPHLSRFVPWPPVEDHWIMWLATDGGRREPVLLDDVGRLVFYANPEEGPWGDRVAGLAPDRERPRVLVVGTNYETRSMAAGTYRERIAAICASHAIVPDRFALAAKLRWFWSNFFEAEQFLARRPKDVPALIIATGYMRNYSDAGGETMEVENRLREIGSRWNIPVEFVPEFCP